MGTRPSQAAPRLWVCRGGQQALCARPPCPGAGLRLSVLSLPSRGLRKGALGMTSVLSLQIVLLSWMVCSCASVGLAPCGLGLSWDQ